MKTILHVIPSLSGGGAERQLALLAAEQGRRGWNVHVALRRGGNYAQNLEGSSVVTHDLGDLRRGHPLLFARLHAIVRKIRPDILQTWLLQMDLVGGAVAIATRTPWVLTERCSRENYDEFPVSGRLRALFGRCARKVVANSNEGASFWREVRGDAASIVTVNNAVDVDAIRACEPQFIDDDRRPTILCVGRIEPQKAHDVLLHAVKLVPAEIRFRVAVIGNGSLEPMTREAIRSLGVEDLVDIRPYQAHWWGYLKTVAGLVNASRFEGQPNVVLEAMAACCPVVVSDIAPHRELLDASSALFVPPNDPHALAHALESIVRHPAEARKRAAAAANLLTQRTVSVVADSYERIYGSV